MHLVRGHPCTVVGFIHQNTRICREKGGFLQALYLLNYCRFPRVGDGKEGKGAGGFRLQTERSCAQPGGSCDARGTSNNPRVHVDVGLVKKASPVPADPGAKSFPSLCLSNCQPGEMMQIVIPKENTCKASNHASSFLGNITATGSCARRAAQDRSGGE